MHAKLVFMFPGQGAQYPTMGRVLYENFSVFKEWIDHAREILWDIGKVDIIKDVILTKTPITEPLDNIRITQPSIVILSVGIAKLLNAYDIYPDLLLGTSLGEIAAGLYADATSLEIMLHHICSHVEQFINLCPEGSMLSLIDVPAKLDILDYSKYGYIKIAYNFPGQYVVAGPRTSRDAFTAYLDAKRVLYEILPLSRAFHTNLIDPAYQHFIDTLKETSFQPLKYPVASAAELTQINSITSEYLWNVVRSPIYFQQLIKKITEEDEYHFIDVGPSGTLAGFINQLKRQKIIPTITNNTSILTPFTKLTNIRAVLDNRCFGYESYV